MKRTLSIIMVLAMLLSAFAIFGAVTPVAATTYPGDINGDGVINAKDSLALKKYFAGGYNVTVVEANADLNNDGVINSKDWKILKEYLAGAINSLPGTLGNNNPPVKMLTIAGNDITSYDLVTNRPDEGYYAATVTVTVFVSSEIF